MVGVWIGIELKLLCAFDNFVNCKASPVICMFFKSFNLATLSYWNKNLTKLIGFFFK